MKIVGLQAKEVMGIWPSINFAFESFAERSQTPLHSLLADVLERRRQCWVVFEDGIKAVALTELDDKAVTLTHCAGEAREGWQVRLVEEIAAWGRHMKAPRTVAVCRPGWAPMLKGLGFKETHRVMERDNGQEPDNKD